MAKSARSKSNETVGSVQLNEATLVANPSTQSRPANISITFLSGLGQATASLFRNGNMINMQTTSVSMTIQFSHVETGDIIALNGVASGSAKVDIDLNTTPATPTTFNAGAFNIIYGVN